MEWRQVRFREIAIVVRRLLHPHPVGLTSLLGPSPGLLGERLPGIEDGRLAVDLEGDRPLDRPERVHVLDLDPGPERLGPAGAERDIGLDPQLPALHVRIGYTDRSEQQLEFLGVAARLFGGSDVRLGDDLHERRA